MTGALAGRSVLITGAGRGLGAAMAERLGADGARLWIADVQLAWAERTAVALREQGVDARPVHVDVADVNSVAAMAATVTADGPLYALVNNAALAANVGGKLFDEIDIAEWDRLLAVNLRGPWLVARAVVPGMRSAGRGRIVNVSSDAALYGSPRLAHYVTSKGGLIALSRAMTRELGPHGITVNTVAPGLTESESSADIPRERHDLYRLNRAIPRPQQPEDLVGAVAFLLGDEAGYLTGQTIVVDGGFVLH